MATATIEKKTACVIGANGYIASLLVKRLLEKGYSVRGTVRDPANQRKVAHLFNLQSLGDLKLFKGDLTEEGCFDDAISGCDLVFHVATPVHFESKDPENDMIKPAIQGVLNVLKSCAKAKTVKRVVLTSSAAAVSVNQLTGTGHVINEGDWTDVEYLTSEKPPAWGYLVSKTLSEKAALKYAEENNINLVTIIPPLVAGLTLTSDVPLSIHIVMTLLTGNESLTNALKDMQLVSGSIALVHVDDVCRAHVFLAENESASGRYICSSVNTCVTDLAKFLSEKYPQYNVPTEFGDFPTEPKLSISSEKLVRAGFSFDYGINEIYDESVKYFKSVGLLAN